MMDAGEIDFDARQLCPIAHNPPIVLKFGIIGRFSCGIYRRIDGVENAADQYGTQADRQAGACNDGIKIVERNISPWT